MNLAIDTGEAANNWTTRKGADELSVPTSEPATTSPYTVIQITNYYAATEVQKAHTDLVRGGPAGSVQY